MSLGFRGIAPFFLACALLAQAGCGGAQQGQALSYGESARRDYERAMGAFDDHDCLTATPLLQHVRREYPYSRYAAMAELRVADCELEQQHYTEAIRAYRSFIRQRPTHPEVDTANFSIALAYYRQIPQDFFLSPPPEERDQAPTRSALRVVRRFLAEFPESDHAEEARRIERQVLLLLARHELYVAQYYLNLDHADATVARVRQLLDEYDGSGIEPQALILLGRTYLHMRNAREAELAFDEVIEQYPESGYVAQARNYLLAMGADVPRAEDLEPEEEGGDGATEEEEEETFQEEEDEEAVETSPRPPAPGPNPGMDIDDVDGTATDPQGGARQGSETDRLEDASQAGVRGRGGHVEAGGTDEGRTADGIQREHP